MSWCRVLWLVLVWMVSDGSLVRAQTNSPLPAITRIGDILKLSREEADRHYPVRLEAVVTFVDSAWGLLFVQDTTAGIFLDKTSPPLELKPGDRVSLQGVTAAGLFTPVIYSAAAKQLGKQPLGKP